jgi:hypothetical protein
LTSPPAGAIEEVWKATFLEQDVNDAAMITNRPKTKFFVIVKIIFSFCFNCNFFLIDFKIWIWIAILNKIDCYKSISIIKSGVKVI